MAIDLLSVIKSFGADCTISINSLDERIKSKNVSVTSDTLLVYLKELEKQGIIDINYFDDIPVSIKLNNQS